VARLYNEKWRINVSRLKWRISKKMKKKAAEKYQWLNNESPRNGSNGAAWLYEAASMLAGGGLAKAGGWRWQ